jgi:hypothetical protein
VRSSRRSTTATPARSLAFRRATTLSCRTSSVCAAIWRCAVVMIARAGMKVPPKINSLDMVKHEIQLVEALSDIEVAATMLKATGGGSMIDANYAKLNVRGGGGGGGVLIAFCSATSNHSTSHPTSSSAFRSTCTTRFSTASRRRSSTCSHSSDRASTIASPSAAARSAIANCSGTDRD